MEFFDAKEDNRVWEKSKKSSKISLFLTFRPLDVSNTLQTSCAQKSKFQAPSMQNRIVKRPKLKQVAAVWKFQNGHFFPKNPLLWTIWPLNVPKTSQNVLYFKIQVPSPEHAKSDCQKAQIEAGGGCLKIVKMANFFQKIHFFGFFDL